MSGVCFVLRLTKVTDVTHRYQENPLLRIYTVNLYLPLYRRDWISHLKVNGEPQFFRGYFQLLDELVERKTGYILEACTKLPRGTYAWL